MEYFDNHKRRAVFIVDLHKFMELELGIKLPSNRSRIIKKLIELNLIERIGMPTSRILVRIKTK